MPYQGPGIYQHYKGGLYEVAGLGFPEENKTAESFNLDDPAQQRVVYRPLTEGSLLDGGPVDFWIRSRVVFDSFVETHPARALLQPRFEWISDTPGRSL